ncbi:MAG: hypothetical protein AB1486_03875 [Planctomycetota bacterium]
MSREPAFGQAAVSGATPAGDRLEPLPVGPPRIDTERKPGQWILTGSRHFPLMEGVTQSLAGRAAVLELHRLSMTEIPTCDWLETACEL